MKIDLEKRKIVAGKLVNDLNKQLEDTIVIMKTKIYIEYTYLKYVQQENETEIDDLKTQHEIEVTNLKEILLQGAALEEELKNNLVLTKHDLKTSERELNGESNQEYQGRLENLEEEKNDYKKGLKWLKGGIGAGISWVARKLLVCFYY